MAIKNAKNFWSGIMFSVFGALFAWASQEYPMGTPAKMGPGFFPEALGLLLLGLGIFIIFTGFKPVEGEEGDGAVSRFDLKSLFIVLLAVGLYGILLPRFGFIVAVFALIMIGAIASHEFKPLEAFLLTLVLLSMGLLVFVWGLELQFPVVPPMFAR